MQSSGSLNPCLDGVNRIEERFKSEKRIVDRGFQTPCWEWTGGKSNSRGYGTIMHKGKQWRVPRLIWTLRFGPIPDGMEVCHKCDNPPCFKPDHLYLATHLQNIRDAYSKGLVPAIKGEDHGCSKLTEKEVIEIRKRYSPGSSRHTLAKEFGVSHNLIYMIAKRLIWKHLP